MENRSLGEKISSKYGVNKEMIILGAGSTPLLRASAIHFSKEGGNIITGDPSYEDLPSHATSFNAKWGESSTNSRL